MTADKLFCQMLDRIEQLTNQNATLQRTVVELQQELKRAQDHTISPSVMKRIEQMALDTPIKPFNGEEWILNNVTGGLEIPAKSAIDTSTPEGIAALLSTPEVQEEIKSSDLNDDHVDRFFQKDRSAIKAREKAFEMFGISYADIYNKRPTPRSFFTYHEMECIRAWVQRDVDNNGISEAYAIENMAEQLCVSKDLIRRIVRSQGRYSK